MGPGIDLLSSPEIAAFLSGEPHLRDGVAAFYRGEAPPSMTVVGPPHLEDLRRRAVDPSHRLAYTSVVLYMELAPSPRTGRLGVMVTCDRRHNDLIGHWITEKPVRDVLSTVIKGGGAA